MFFFGVSFFFFTFFFFFFFFFNDTATTEIYTLSLHDALPICPVGLGHLVPCQSPHNAEGGNGASRPHCSIGCHAKTNCARRGDHPSRKCSTIHHVADLCPHQRIFEEVVRRHWRTRQARPTPCGYRNSGSRPATPAGPQQPADREGKSRARLDNEIPVSGTLEKQRCLPARRR